MAIPRNLRDPGLGTLMAALVGSGLLAAAQAPGQAGPLVRRAQERQACQEFAARLQQAGGNPAAAQQVYQQGVLALVERFGENPCTDIAAPAAAPATSAAPAPTPATPGTSGGGAAAGNPQQQACQQFATKVQTASATAGSVAARQTYARGLETLTGLFGANPCPAVKPPQ